MPLTKNEKAARPTIVACGAIAGGCTTINVMSQTGLMSSTGTCATASIYGFAAAGTLAGISAAIGLFCVIRNCVSDDYSAQNQTSSSYGSISDQNDLATVDTPPEHISMQQPRTR